MVRTISLFAAVVLACTWLLAGDQRVAARIQTDVDAVARRAFAERIERYAMLRARLEEPLPAFDASRDPWSLLWTRRYLASAIRAARPRACLGDIFTSDVSGRFRDDIARAVHSTDIEGLVLDDLAKDDFLVDLVVGEPIPKWALRPVPTPLLEQLLPLPDAIEYRLVGTALVLWDVHAEILIDALPDAF